MERHQQVLALAVLFPVAAHAHGQRLDIFGVSMVITNEPHHRQVALFFIALAQPSNTEAVVLTEYWG